MVPCVGAGCAVQRAVARAPSRSAGSSLAAKDSRGRAEKCGPCSLCCNPPQGAGPKVGLSCLKRSSSQHHHHIMICMINQFEDLDLFLKLCILVAGREVGAQKASTVRLLYIYIYIYIYRYAYKNIHISETQDARHMISSRPSRTYGKGQGKYTVTSLRSVEPNIFPFFLLPRGSLCRRWMRCSARGC